MFKLLIVFCSILVITFQSIANESLLTLQQQVERLQREVSDISKSVYSNDMSKNDAVENNSSINLSAIDMRIYDLEKDMKNLNANLEELYFKLEDILKEISKFKNEIERFQKDSTKTNNEDIENSDENIEKNEIAEIDSTNTLGSLKISSTQNQEKNNTEDVLNIEEQNQQILVQLSPEEQFQKALESIRNKKYQEAQISFKNFIKDNSNNQLSGSAHYWLGELYILEKKYRDAAIVLAEGYQNYSESIKAPDMLFKLAQSLIEVNKNDEACKTFEKFLEEYSDHKFANKTKKILVSNECVSSN
mgnify:CR=1 FL=1